MRLRVTTALVHRVRGGESLMVPRVHQIVFRDPSAPETDGYIARAMQTVREAFPRCEYQRWELGQARQFIATNHSAEVLRAQIAGARASSMHALSTP
jgi:hypothetical protein